MKILIISSYFQPAWDWGGVVTAIWNLVIGLARQGIDVTVLTTNAKQFGVVDVPKERIEEGVRIITEKVAGGGHWTFANRFGIAPSLYLQIEKHVSTTDLAHIDGFWGPVPAFSAAMAIKARKPFIISPHGGLDRWPLSQKRLKKNLFLWTVGKLLMSRAAAYHFTADEELKQAPKWLVGDKGVVVPNAVVAEHKGDERALRKKLNIGEDVLLVGMAGRMHKIKGFDIIVPALAKAGRRDILLAVAGPDEAGYKNAVEGYAQQLNVSDRIIYLGMLDGQQLADAYAGLDILAVPSYHENFGMVVIEALLQGTPAMVSEGVALKDWVKEKDVGLVLPLDIDAWARALAELDKREIKRRWDEARLAKAALESFSEDSVAKQMIRHYEQIILQRRNLDGDQI